MLESIVNPFAYMSNEANKISHLISNGNENCQLLIVNDTSCVLSTLIVLCCARVREIYRVRRSCVSVFKRLCMRESKFDPPK